MTPYNNGTLIKAEMKSVTFSKYILYCLVDLNMIDFANWVLTFSDPAFSTRLTSHVKHC